MAIRLALLFGLAWFQDGPASEPWVVYEPADGRANGKHVVLIAGDEEYRSEEALPMLGRILARRHGFRCTVLFSIDPETGAIDPDEQTNVPGLEHLDRADLMICFLRFRELPDEAMKHFVDFVEAGKPLVGLRTSTHAFDYRRDEESAYRRYGWNDREWKGGFGKQILGETWVAHHGAHGSESTRGVLEEDRRDHPILRGVGDVWGPTDVYTVGELPPDATVLVRGQVLAGMTPDAAPVAGAKNAPMMPIVWTRAIARESGPPQRVVCSTIGASQDLESEGLRRLLVNACYWGLGMEENIPARSDVDFVGDYDASPFGFGKAKKGVRPEDLALGR